MTISKSRGSRITQRTGAKHCKKKGTQLSWVNIKHYFKNYNLPHKFITAFSLNTVEWNCKATDMENMSPAKGRETAPVKVRADESVTVTKVKCFQSEDIILRSVFIFKDSIDRHAPTVGRLRRGCHGWTLLLRLVNRRTKSPSAKTHLSKVTKTKWGLQSSLDGSLNVGWYGKS